MIEAIEYLKNAYLTLELRTKKLEEENQSLGSEIALLKKTDLSNKLKKVNEQSNKPSSKQADWEEKGVGNDGKGKKKGVAKKEEKGRATDRKTSLLLEF